MITDDYLIIILLGVGAICLHIDIKTPFMMGIDAVSDLAGRITDIY